MPDDPLHISAVPARSLGFVVTPQAIEEGARMVINTPSRRRAKTALLTGVVLVAAWVTWRANGSDSVLVIGGIDCSAWFCYVVKAVAASLVAVITTLLGRMLRSVFEGRTVQLMCEAWQRATGGNVEMEIVGDSIIVRRPEATNITFPCHWITGRLEGATSVVYHLSGERQDQKFFLPVPRTHESCIRVLDGFLSGQLR